MPDDAKSTLLAIAKLGGSFAVGVIASTFWLGGREAKINQLVSWKEQTAPQIQRMDQKGTLSFEYFQDEYNRTQGRQEKRLDILEKEVHDLEQKPRQ